jgi:hypothetical protein
MLLLLLLLVLLHEVVQVDFKLKLEEPFSNIVHMYNISMHEVYAMMNSRGITHLLSGPCAVDFAVM